MKEHIDKYHHEVLRCNCKLCSGRFESEVLHIKHRTSQSHQIISKGAEEQFMLEIGNFCEECHISGAEDNNTHNFCENDEHIETFQNIWSNRHCGCMPICGYFDD